MIISQETINRALQTIDQHQVCNAGNLITTKRQMRAKLATIHCPVSETRNQNWAFVIIPQAEFVLLDGIINADGTPGTPVPQIVDPGQPRARTMAEVETWRYRKDLYESYQNVLSCA